MASSVQRAWFAVLSAGLTACATPPRLPPQPPPTDYVPPQDSPATAMDRVLRAQVASYVGLGFGAEGQLVVTLGNAADIAAAEQLTDKVWTATAKERGLPVTRRPRFQANVAPSGPQELSAAFASMRDVLTLPKVVFLGLDATCGCITVGISDASAATAVAGFAAQRGLQPNVVRTVLTAPVVRVAGLRSQFRPTVGGIEITAGSFCTLGLPVYSFRHSLPGFLTAAHCTTQQGGADATSFFQEAEPVPGTTFTAGPAPPPPAPIAIEVDDPPLVDLTTEPRCPTQRRCRYSDVAFAAYLGFDKGRFGRIARPTSSCGLTACSLDLERATDDIRVTIASLGGVPGERLHKIGRTTGWTSGDLIEACTDVNVVNDDGSDTGITLICQYRVRALTRPGDSGSPVFLFHAPSGTASFEGILWGGPPRTSADNYFFYSPVAGIQRELGSFVFNQQGVASPFRNGRFYTSNFDDELVVVVEPNAVPPDQVEFVLNGGTRISAPKQLVLVEGTTPPANNGRWTLSVTRNGDTARNGLYLYQLAGGHLEFRRREPGSSALIEVTRVPIDSLAPGTRVTFTWEDD